MDMVGRHRLESSGALWENTPWGGMQLDLTVRPWEDDFMALSSRQTQVMRGVSDSGVYGDYKAFLAYTAGPAWTPFPDPEMPAPSQGL